MLGPFAGLPAKRIGPKGENAFATIAQASTVIFSECGQGRQPDWLAPVARKSQERRCPKRAPGLPPDPTEQAAPYWASRVPFLIRQLSQG